MALELKQHCTFTGPALPEPFVQFELEKELTKANLLPKVAGKEGQTLQESWEIYRRKLRELISQGGAIRVRNHVIEPLLERLGYAQLEAVPEVETREGREAGGYLLTTADGASKLRVWCTDFNTDLDAPAKRGAAYRYSHLRIAQRVLLACGERLGLLTNGVELRLLISDPARPDSQVTIAIDPNWKRSRNVPDSYRLVLALASPAGVKALPDLVDKARLQQARVTKELRVQARLAVERFIQEVLDQPANREVLGQYDDRTQLAKDLWREGLIIVYRLLFVLKLEASDDVARSFSFASTSLWRNSFSPSMALTRYVRKVLDEGAETGGLLEDGLRTLFRMFTEGVQCTELNVKPLGGALFGASATPILSQLRWGERAVAKLLDQLLWTSPRRGGGTRERVHYGPLDVEDLGRVYEALLELEPGISTEPMCRLRRQKLEVVVPAAQGEKYRPANPQPLEVQELAAAEEAEAEEELEEEEDESPKRGKKTKVEWIEEIPPGRFYLRVGLGRKASGSYYTPHSFVRFLVQETLGPQVAERSPKEDSNPLAILKLKVLDPAMGSGHFLVEACRFLGDKLYEACRLCDERALAAEQRAEKAKTAEDKDAALAEAGLYWNRVVDLPDPDDKLMKYLPSSAPEGKESGFSQQEAIALCRRLVAVHCLYGVDKNPLAVELAKLSLWIESHAEGLPLTFLDHRLVLGDSLTGPFFEHLFKEPASGDDVQKLIQQDVNKQFRETLTTALRYVRELEASVGTDLSDIEAKQTAKQSLDRALAPFKILAAAWSGGVMLGDESGDTDYATLFSTIAQTGDLPEDLLNKPKLLAMIAKGLGVEIVPGDRSELLELLASGKCVPALSYDLTFAEVFYPDGNLVNRQGFNAFLGNPPWDQQEVSEPEFWAAYDLEAIAAPTTKEREAVLKRVSSESEERRLMWLQYQSTLAGEALIAKQLYQFQVVEVDGKSTVGKPDAFRLFCERVVQVLVQEGYVGLVVPSAFHANEGATGVRQLFLQESAIKTCFSFENKHKLFEIHASFKFATLVAQKSRKGTTDFSACFYLRKDSWLFDEQQLPQPLQYSRKFIEETSGLHLTFVECNQPQDVPTLLKCHTSSKSSFGRYLDSSKIRLTQGFSVTREDHLLTPIEKNSDNKNFLVHEGKTFHQYQDFWDTPIRYVTFLEQLIGKAHWLKSVCFFRLAFRKVAGATDGRTAMFAILPPGTVFTESVCAETTPHERQNCKSLLTLAALNSFSFDWLTRLKVRANVNFFLLRPIPFPNFCGLLERLLAHAALRLTCNHPGYELLWHEQLGDEWRELDKASFTFPVLATEDDRWSVRAVIDAVVAQAYGLDRDQYVHVLSTFSHKSYPKAPQLCLDRFDELEAIGLEAFTKKYDPYWDIPLNENLPQPVIDLPIPKATEQLPLLKKEVSPTDRHVALLTKIIHLHREAKREKTLGHIKAEKITHVIENHLDLDFGRNPVKDVAGPVDFPNLKKVTYRAEKLNAFKAQERGSEQGYEFEPLSGFDRAVEKSAEVFGEIVTEVDRLISLFLPMDTERAEIIATLYAVWNDLLIETGNAADQQIIEDFYAWNLTKQRFERDRILKALQWMRDYQLVPTGKGKPTTIKTGKSNKASKSTTPGKKPRKGAKDA